jgi:hypothetical protein
MTRVPLLAAATTLQGLSEARNNMIALSGQRLSSSEILVCLYFSGKNEAAGKCHAVSELELALAA